MKNVVQGIGAGWRFGGDGLLGAFLSWSEWA